MELTDKEKKILKVMVNLPYALLDAVSMLELKDVKKKSESYRR